MVIKPVSHGQSQANVDAARASVATEHLVPLMAFGIAQAREAGRTLDGSFLTASLIYTSPFRRA